MKFSAALLFAGLSSGVALAGVTDNPVSSKGISVEPAAGASRWSFGIAFAPILNVEASFSGLGGFDSPFAPQPLGGGRNYNYDDGFVRVDSSGNSGGVTSNWGYDNAAQYNAAGSGSISNNITNSLRNGRAGETEEASPGLEIYGYLQMGSVAEISNRPITWGLKGGLHYATISIDGSSSLTADVERLTDSFDLGGVLPPGAGYAGTPGGPGPLLGDSPTRNRTLIADGASVQGRRSFDVDLLSFSAGPYLEIPLSEKFSIFAETGINLAIVHGDYEYATSTTITGLGTRERSGSESETKMLPGAYAGVSAVWQISNEFGLYGAARYQYFDSYDLNANGSRAGLDFDGSAVISLGGIWRF